MPHATQLSPLEFHGGDCKQLEAVLEQKIYEYNAELTGYHDGDSFGISQRDSLGSLVAGITGYTWGGCCYVAQLWVEQRHRRQGLGASLLEAAEKLALEKGCSLMILSSHNFQSPRFYERLGYLEVGRVHNHPVGYSNVMLAKRLR